MAKKPTIEGTIIRDVLLNCTRGGSNKDYQIIKTRADDGTFNLYTLHGPQDRLNQGMVQGTGLTSFQADTRIGELLKEKQAKRYEVVHDVFSNISPSPVAPAPVAKSAQKARKKQRKPGISLSELAATGAFSSNLIF